MENPMLEILHFLDNKSQLLNTFPLLNPEPFYLVGPTSSGKSALGLELAARLGGEIINADAYQLYRGLDICTAKPSAADRARVSHHLYDVLAPWELSDAQFYT
jgi:tRNA dimethylallyltransferase